MGKLLQNTLENRHIENTVILKTQKITEQNIMYNIIRKMYKQDYLHISAIHKLHISIKMSIEDEIVLYATDTYNGVKNDEFMLFKLNDTNIGYYTYKVIDSVFYLNGFHVIPEFRSAFTFDKIWKSINIFAKKMPIIMSTIEKNKPMRDHLKRNGFEIISNGSLGIEDNYLDHKIITLIKINL